MKKLWDNLVEAINKLISKKYFLFITRGIVVIFTLYLFHLNFVRIFEENIWGDEAFTANIIRLSIPDLINRTGIDVHPPLYYLLLKIFCNIFGETAVVMHAFSLIPLVILLVFSLTIGWKRFGVGYTLISVVMLNIAESSVRFNVEIRMYTLAAMLVFFSYYMVYRIIFEGGVLRDYILFYLFSILAAYTHYYALIAVSFFYVALFLRAVIKYREQIKYSILITIMAIITYLPWLRGLIRSFTVRVNNYWITEIPTYSECFNYIMSNTFNNIMWFVVIVLTIIAFLYETRILRLNRRTRNEWLIGFYKEIIFTDKLQFVLFGLASIIGTMAVGITVSKIFSPFFVTRYIYVVAPVAWLALALILQRLNIGKFLSVLLALFLFIKCMPVYQETAYWDNAFNESAMPIIESAKEVANGDIIICNDTDHTIPDYYFYGKEYVCVGAIEDIEWDSYKNTMWFYLNDSWSIDMLYDEIESRGLSCETIVENGILGKGVYSVYKVY